MLFSRPAWRFLRQAVKKDSRVLSPPGAPGATAVTGPENKYVELSHSKDRVIKATAERYLSLIKFQEWGGASGKTQIAKYVSHDPDLKQVKLSIARGIGKDRV